MTKKISRMLSTKTMTMKPTTRTMKKTRMTMRMKRMMKTRLSQAHRSKVQDILTGMTLRYT